MARNILFNKFDIFISYPVEIQTKVFELFDLLTNFYSLNVWCDLNMVKQPPVMPNSLTVTPKIVQPNPKICEHINNSKLFLLAIDDSLASYETCEIELNYAMQHRKRILCMMLKNKPIQEYGKLGLLILSLPKIEFYKDSKNDIKWSGVVFDKFIDLIELMMAKRINRSQSIAITGLGISSVAIFTTRPTQNSKRQVQKQVQVKKYHQVKSTKPLNIPAKRITRMAFLNSKKRILYCDPDSNLIHSTDSYGSSSTKLNLKELKKPYTICCSRKHEVFIGDQEHEMIFVYDNQLNFKRKFSDFNLTKNFEIDCDQDNGDLILVTIYGKNQLNLLNSETGEIVITKDGLEKPGYVKAKNDRIYLVCNNDKLVILRHDTYDIIKEIKFDNWCFVRTIHIDSKMNIITTAYEKGFPIAFLYLIDNEGSLLSKVYIHMKEIEDLLVIDEKKFFFNSEISSLCILEFE